MLVSSELTLSAQAWNKHVLILSVLILYSYIWGGELSYSMEQSSSWEANQFSASQEIPCLLWNPKVHHCVHKCPPPVPVLSQLDPFHTPMPYFLKIHFSIILPSMPGSSFPQLSPPKPWICLSYPPYVLHALPIPFFFILSPEQYWARSTDH